MERWFQCLTDVERMAPLVPNLRTFVITVSPYDELLADRFLHR
jgi:hypothetical protein